MNNTIAEFDISYAYGQFHVFDESAGPCSVAWTDQHCRQGFCRDLSAADFGTLDEWGIGHIRVRKTGFDDVSHLDRLITVPFFAPSGVIAVQGPEAPPPVLFSIGEGYFRLWVGQYIIGDGEKEGIELFFEKLVKPALKSEIKIKDELLQPDLELMEE